MTQCAQQLLVRHAGGEQLFDTTTFTVDDKSAVLLVFSDPGRKLCIAAFNREFWIAAEFVEREEVDDG
ncbi:hypothetical protein DW322_08830 [Rhodococcus rhodnii]|uniref:Uncharacterized protein n=2 Tax=Rhodococcus rhodnii TaxID=38312 RepID=R7WRH9_9NOCA|nr:hypothetical protein [Rhodococcus rhodnii]EOM77906.1 hypothetical protein Rrhod_0715 [Rhodococcus rhodnii LMG 5362]TXG90309.1 hypothetical protein DW322_08830 [Rhodococcus rhodnii]